MNPSRGARSRISRYGAAVAASLLIAIGALCVVYASTHQEHAAMAPLAAAAKLSPVPEPSTDTTESAGPVLPPSVPVAITIPAIRVKTALLQLGLNPDGSLQVPPHGPHYGDAGWYRYSPTPGSLGPSVIVGHVDSAHGGPSVFFHLANLVPGDVVQVARADGSVATFTVDAVVRYHKAEFPTALVYSDTDYAALRLITCGGPIDPKTHHYRDNTVVFATMVSSSPSPSAPSVAAG